MREPGLILDQDLMLNGGLAPHVQVISRLYLSSFHPPFVGIGLPMDPFFFLKPLSDQLSINKVVSAQRIAILIIFNCVRASQYKPLRQLDVG